MTQSNPLPAVINFTNRYARWIIYALLLLGQTLAFLIFKDLADISQWVIQSSREFTMVIWYARWPMAIIGLLSMIMATIIWKRKPTSVNKWLMAVLWIFFVLNWYSGMLNPGLMFRTKQHDAQFVSVQEAPKFLQQSLKYSHYGSGNYEKVDDISVIVLETDQGAIAYTDYYLLQPHVVKGGTINGTEVVMTYCGLTNLGIAYTPEINGIKLDLGVMTQLENNLVMFDKNSGKPIQQLYGSAEGDSLDKMRQWPTIRMPFSSFSSLYPEGKVFINEIPDFNDNPVIAVWDRLVRHVIMLWGVGLQWDNEAPAFPTIDIFDYRLPVKTLIYGLNIGEDYVAYTKEFVSENGIINTVIGSRSVVVSYDDTYDVLTAFYNDSGKFVLEVDPLGLSDQGQLQRIETLKCAAFWFIWANFYPQTDVNRV